MPRLVVGHRPPAPAAGRGDPDMPVGWNWKAQCNQGLAAPCKFRREEGHRLHHSDAPRVLPVVVYHGERRWPRVAAPSGVPLLLQPGGYAVLDAGAGELEDWPYGNRVSAWVRLLRSEDLEKLLVRLVEGLREFPGPLDEGFREALYAWASVLWERRMPGAAELPPLSELESSQGVEEMTSLIEANLDKWEAGLVQQGMERGIAQGRTEGLERGIAQGKTEARAQLGRLAGRKFGDRAAERLAALIEGESDPERLAEVGDWIIDCDTEAEFLARADRGG